MIKIKKNDSLSKVIKKIKLEESTEVFLEFPVWQWVIHDFNSLKILKNTFKNKKLVFVSKDITAKRYFTKLWLHFTLIKDEGYLKKNLEKQKNILKANTSFREYLIYEVQKKWAQIQKKIQKTTAKKAPKKSSHSFPFILVAGIFAVSSFLLFFIFYLAVHKTYIYVSPEIEVLKIQRNFQFNNSAELSLNENSIKLREITIEASLKGDFSATNVELWSTKQAAGEVEIFNEIGSPITLVEGTKFINDEWIVFTMQKKTEIPAWNIASEDATATPVTTVYLVADNFDLQGNFIGSRWNLEWVILSIPGLEWEYKNRIYWKIKKTEGGIDDYDVFVWEDDIETWSELLKIKLEDEALKKLQEKIKTLNTENNEDYALLLSNNTLIYEDFIFNNSDGTSVWDKKRKFELDGTLKLRGFIYNRNFVFSKLETIATQKLIEDNRDLVITDKSSLAIAHMIYDRKTEDDQINVKATMEIEILIQKNFNSNDYYTELLKNKIVWLPKNQAYDILLNSNNINKASIKNSPFFIKKVSTKIENIFFKINK